MERTIWDEGGARSREDELKVVITADHCSTHDGGEAILPFNYFRYLRARGTDVHLVTHVRSKAQLEQAFPEDRDRLHFVADTPIQRMLHCVAKNLPDTLARFTAGALIGIITQWRQKVLLRRLIREHGISVVHQPYPVSPAEPSLIHGLGVPVVIGPMNGAMSYPPGLRDEETWVQRTFIHLTRQLRHLASLIFPGKRLARILLVANERTRAMLPSGTGMEVIDLAENGVDLKIWKPSGRPRTPGGGPVRFVYLGRLVEWKGVDYLLEAWARAACKFPAELLIVGDGVMRRRWEELSRSLGLSGSVRFLGHLPRPECSRILADSDVLVLPSVKECGGAVVLEALASGLPVIATAWGGPMDYLDDSCGILVPPTSRGAFIDGLARAIEQLGASPQRREQMVQPALRRAAEYCWEVKVERMLEIYRRATWLDRAADPREPECRRSYTTPHAVELPGS